jgi:hypothetical protein
MPTPNLGVASLQIAPGAVCGPRAAESEELLNKTSGNDTIHQNAWNDEEYAIRLAAVQK